MRVRFIPTGQIGDVPDNEFDPSIYQPLDAKTNAPIQTQAAPQSPAPASDPLQGQTDLLGGILNFGKGVANNLYSPIRFATAGLVQAPVAELTGGKVNTRDLPVIGGLLGYSNEDLKKYSGDVNESWSDREKKVFNKALKESIKATAMFATPGMATGLGGVPVVGSKIAALPGAGFKFGALEGLGQGLGEDQISQNQLLMSMLAGGVTSKVLSKLPTTSKAASDAALEADKATLLPVVKANPYMANQEAEIINGAAELFPKAKGDPYKIKSLMPAKMEEIGGKVVNKNGKIDIVGGEIGKLLTGEPLPDATTIFKQLYDDKMLNQTSFGIDKISAPAGEVEDIVYNILNTGGKPTDKTLYAAKQAMGENATKAFTKVANGQLLEPKEVAALEAWDTLKEMLGQLGRPELDKLNKQQNIMYMLSPGIQNFTKGNTPSPGLGSAVNIRRGVGKVVNTYARGMENVSNLTSPLGNISPEVMSQLGGNVGASITSSSFRQPQTNQQMGTNQVIDPRISDLKALQEQITLRQQDEATSQSPVITAEQMMNLELAPGIKESTKNLFRKAYAIQMANTKAGQDPVAIRQSKLKVSQAVEKLTELKRFYDDNKLSQGVISGNMARAGAALQLSDRDKKMAAYLKLKDGAIPIVGRGMGEVGNLAKEEQDRYAAMIPAPWDTPEVANDVWNMLFTMLGSKPQ